MVFVDLGLIDGTEHDSNGQNRVGCFYDLILGGAPVLYLFACLPS